MLRLLTLTTALILPMAALADDDWRKKFPNVVFGVGTGENAQSAAKRWEAFGEYLQSCLGVQKVTVRVASDYSAIIESQTQGDTHLTWTGPAGYATGWDISGGNIEPVAMDVSKNGDLGYRWVVVVKSDSPYQKLEDLKGKTLGWPSPTSASGFVLPMQYFRDIGYVDKNNKPIFFKQLVQTGSHDNSLVSVVQGKIDAATNWYYSPKAGSHTRAAGAGTIKLEDIRFIYESPVVPNAPFVAIKSLPEPMKKAMSACIINMPWADPARFATVAKDTFGGFAYATHDMYQEFIKIRMATK